MEIGNWRLELELEIGEWRMEIGEWRLEIGDWRLEIGEWRLEIGEWRLEIYSPFFNFSFAVLILAVNTLYISSRSCMRQSYCFCDISLEP